MRKTSSVKNILRKCVPGLRRLQYHGLKIRSHHGETWRILRTGIQSVDNAMNIWHIDTLEHGLSLGINPNYYFHRIYQKVMESNSLGIAIEKVPRSIWNLWTCFGMT